MDHLFAKFRLRTGDGLTFFWIIAVTAQAKYGRERHPMLFSHSPEARSNQATRREMQYSQPTRNARVRHGSAEGARQAYLIGFVLAVTVISVLADTGNYLELFRRTRDLPQETLIKLGSEWGWNERRYWRPGKTIISSVLTVIDVDEMGRIVRKRLFRAVAGRRAKRMGDRPGRVGKRSA
jgi:hypothetical protein